jgi:signal transduction histidine kinase
MSAEHAASDGIISAPIDQLRHDLKTPLTTIHGRAQLLDRAIRRFPALPEDQRARMLAAFTAIETAVQTLCAVIDTIGDEDRGS